MKSMLRNILVLLGLFLISDAYAQRAKDGSYTATGANEVLNTYTDLTANASAGATTLTVSNNSMTGGAFGGTPLQQGDLILIIQTQGANVDINNFPVIAGWGSYTWPQSYFSSGFGIDPQTFGQVLNEGSMAAGRFERVEVFSTSGTNQITLTCGLSNAYVAGDNAQIVRIPRFDDLTVNNGAAIVPTLWNGTTGGVVALEVDGTLTVNNGGSISATGYGFRGGELDNNFTPGIANTGGSGADRFLGSPSGFEGSEKGESIFGYHTEYDGLDSRYGVAPIANGGGGGGFVNSGGGGGSNAEVGAGAFNAHGNPVPGYAAAYGQDPLITASSGGGQGGYALSQSNQNAGTTGPNNAAWSGDGRKNAGGWGGHPLTYNANRIFFGGGGGAGDQDSGEGGAGGRGGGIVYIVNYGTIAGGGEIQVNGGAGENSNPSNAALGFNAYRGNDGAGGGGGAGTVYIENAAAIPNTIDINAVGGDGGDQNLQVNAFQLNEAGGPGGAGSGGIIRFSSGAPAQSVISGAAGVTTSTHLTEFPPNGSTQGSTGDANLPAPYFDLIPNDVTICAGQTASPSVTVQGSYTGTLNWYTVQYGGTAIAGQTNQLTYNVSPATTTTYWVGVCPGTFRVPVTVTVTAAPNLITTDPAAVCAPNTVDITLPAITAGSDAGTLTYWQDNGATITQGTPGAVGAGWHYIQLDAGGGCTTLDSVFVTVNPSEDATFVSGDYCEGGSNTISGVVTPGGTFTIQSQTGSGGVTIAAGTGILSNGVAGDQITIEYTTSGPCPNSSTQVVNVLSLDDATFVSGDFCASSVNTISGVVTPGGTFTIASQTGSGGVTIAAGTGILSNFVAGDQITIQYTTSGACPNSSQVVVNVTNLDDASFTSADFCANAVNTISGVVTPGGTFTIASQTGSGGVTITAGTGVLANFVAGDQVTIEYTTPAGGCQNSSQVVVNVLGLDDASFTSGDYCVGGSNTISGVATPGGTFTIQSQTGSGSVTIAAATGILSGGVAGDQITIEYTTPAGGCQNASTQVVNVLPLDDATFVSGDFCASSVNTISGVVTPGGTFTIASQTGSGGVTIAAATGILSNYVAGDQVTIQYTTSGTCPNSSTVVVNVTNLDDASFTSADFCANAVNTISGVVTPGGIFTIASQTGSGGVTITAGTGVLANFVAGDQVTIEYTTPAGGCQNSSQVVVNVLGLDDASFTSGDYCIGGTNTISGVTTPGGTFTIQSQTGSGSVTIAAATGILSGGVAGDQVTIEYTTPAGGCQNSSTQVVNLLPLEDATFVSGDFCASSVNTISGVVTPGGTFTIASQTGSGGVTITAGTGILANYVAGDQITIEYTTNGTCPSSSQVVVNVTNLDDASFTSADFCASSVNTVSGIITPGGTFTIASQTGSGGVTITAGTGVLANFVAGDQVTIQYTTPAGGCQNSSQVVVNVLGLDNASFTSVDYCVGGSNIISGVATPGGTFAIASQTGSGSVTIAAATGILSGGAAGDQVTIEYTTPAGGCPNTSTQVVNILPLDDATFVSGDFCVSAVNVISGVVTPGGIFSIAAQTGSGGVTIAAGTGVLSNFVASDQITIEYTTNGTCPNSSQVVVNVTDLDDASFTTADFCENSVNTISGIVTPGGTFAIVGQTGSGGVTIAAATGILSNYFGGDQVTIEYTTPAGGCPNTSQVVVNITALDDAGFNYSAAAYCVDALTQTPTITGLAGGTFSSTAGLSLTPGTGDIDVSTSTPGTYTVTYTTAGPCPNSSDVSVTINALPVISVVTPVDVCLPNSATLDATAPGTGFVFEFFDPGMTSLGSGTVTGNNSVLNVSPATSGIYNYSVTITDPVTGCASSATIVVNVTDPDDASFSYSAAAFCQEGTDPSPVVTGLGGGTFSSTPGLSITAGTGDIDLSASTPGTYTVTYTTNGTCPNSSDVLVTINATPTISGPTSVCPLSTMTLSGTGTPDPTTPWTSSNTAIATVSNTGDVYGVAVGSVTITYLDANGCTNTYAVTVSAAPILDPYAPIVGCDSIQLPTITGTGLTGNEAYYTGSGGTGTQYAGGDWIYASTPIYVLDLSNPCTVEQSTVITINTSPTVSGGNNVCEASTLTLSGTGTPDPITPWTSSNTGVATVDNLGVVSGVAGGTVDITYTDNNGCSNTITVTVNPTPTISGNAPICVGSTNTLTGSGTPDATTPWSSSDLSVATVDNAGVVTAIGAGTATITYLDANGCSTTEVVTINAAPNLVITDPAAVCDPLTVDLTVAAVTAGSDAGTLTYWTDNLATMTLATPNAVATTNTYYIQLDDGNCTSIQPVDVTVNPMPTIVLTDPVAVCDPSLVDLTDGAVTAGSDPGTFTYFDALGAAVPDATQVGSGNYFITLQDANGCQSVGQVTATVNPTPNLIVTDPAAVCEPNLIDLTDVAVTAGSDAGSLTYWDDMTATSATAAPGGVAQGTYYIQLEDANGCTSIAAVNATINPLDDASFTMIPTCDGATAQVMGASGGTFSLLSATSATIDPLTGTVIGASYGEVLDIEYATNSLLCPNTAVEMVVVDDCTPEDLIIPTAFTPGADGAHDTWEIVGLDNLYPNNRVLVYNRWGNKVFEHNSSVANPYINNMWDGTYNGSVLPVASYYYIIETNDTNSTDKFEGTVTILQ